MQQLFFGNLVQQYILLTDLEHLLTASSDIESRHCSKYWVVIFPFGCKGT